MIQLPWRWHSQPATSPHRGEDNPPARPATSQIMTWFPSSCWSAGPDWLMFTSPLLISRYNVQCAMQVVYLVQINKSSLIYLFVCLWNAWILRLITFHIGTNAGCRYSTVPMYLLYIYLVLVKCSLTIKSWQKKVLNVGTFDFMWTDTWSTLFGQRTSIPSARHQTLLIMASCPRIDLQTAL